MFGRESVNWGYIATIEVYIFWNADGDINILYISNAPLGYGMNISNTS